MVNARIEINKHQIMPQIHENTKMVIMKKGISLKVIATVALLSIANSLFSQQNKITPQKYEVWEDTSQIQLQWYLLGLHKMKDFKIYRSLQLKNDFRQINVEHGFSAKKDTLLFLVFDKTVTPNFAYDYYIVPIDENERDLPKSEIITAKSYDINILPLIKRLKAVGISDEKTIVISWETRPSPYLRNFTIYRSDKYDGPYMQIANLPPDKKQYTDKVMRGNENYYYYIAVNGPFGEGYPSAKVFGMFEAKEKPIPPQRVYATASGKGILISWDVMDLAVNGFYVYRAEGYQGELKQISLLLQVDSSMVYLDTSAALSGGQVYSYAIVTAGQGDVLSDFSERVSAMTVIPLNLPAPKNIRLKLIEGKVLLMWEDMTANNLMVLSYKVFRRVKGAKDFELLASIMEISSNYYEDRNVVEGTAYEYALAVVDITGAEGARSLPVSIVIPEILPAPPGGVVAFKSTDGISIEWNTLQENLKEFKLYRSDNGATFKFLTSVTADKKKHLDKGLTKGKVYIYYVTAINQKERESKNSEEVSLRY